MKVVYQSILKDISHIPENDFDHALKQSFEALAKDIAKYTFPTNTRK